MRMSKAHYFSSTGFSQCVNIVASLGAKEGDDDYSINTNERNGTGNVLSYVATKTGDLKRRKKGTTAREAFSCFHLIGAFS